MECTDSFVRMILEDFRGLETGSRNEGVQQTGAKGKCGKILDPTSTKCFYCGCSRHVKSWNYYIQS